MHYKHRLFKISPLTKFLIICIVSIFLSGLLSPLASITQTVYAAEKPLPKGETPPKPDNARSVNAGGPPPGGITVDNSDYPKFIHGGDEQYIWTYNCVGTQCYGSDMITTTPSMSASYENWGRWTPDLPTGGRYKVYVCIGKNANVPSAQYQVNHKYGTTPIIVDQNSVGSSDVYDWFLLGEFEFDAGSYGSVYLNDVVNTDDRGGNYKIGFDAVSWELISDPITAPSDFSAIPISSEQINLYWKDRSNNETHFVILRSKYASFSIATVEQISSPDSSGTGRLLNYSDNGFVQRLEPNTTYYYRVFARKDTGNTNYTDSMYVQTSARTTPAPSNTIQVTSSTDTGDVTRAGSLSYALNSAVAGQEIIFNVASVQVRGVLPTLRAGAKIIANCSATGPTITIDGGNLAVNNTLKLGGSNKLQGLKFRNFTRSPINTNGTTGNTFKCIKIDNR